MKLKTVAFDEAYASLHRLGIPNVLPTLHAAGVCISRAVLGGSHSVAVYPPINSLTPLEPFTVFNNINCSNEISLYVHIAFCETRCTFCHYTVSQYGGKGRSSQTSESEVKHYLDALKKELKFWGAKLAKSATLVSSVYIGGGTPLLLEREDLYDIIRVIQDEYKIMSDAEICIEGSPLTITAPDGEDKLRFLREIGFTRLSFGVQSFDNTVLKYAARGYKREVPINAALIANRVFENWNLDLIQGLYKSSPSETWESLKVINEIRPPHITWYHGRFADRPQGDWYKMDSKNAFFEDEFATLLGRMLIWQELSAIGYHQNDGNRFMLERKHTDPFKKIRTSSSSNLLGVGAASYSHIGTEDGKEDCRGYVFRNQSNIRAYADCVLAGNIPINSGRIIDDEELLAASYATGLRNGRIEDEELRSIRRKKIELSLHYKTLAKKMLNIDILENYTDVDHRKGLRITELGKLFEDETLALFFSPAVRETLGWTDIN